LAGPLPSDGVAALREWAYAEVHPHSDVRRDKFQRWIHRYNWHRPHTSRFQIALNSEQPGEAPHLELISKVDMSRAELGLPGRDRARVSERLMPIFKPQINRKEYERSLI